MAVAAVRGTGRYGIKLDVIYSGLMFAARSITLIDFSVSSVINLPNSVGEPASTVPPSSTSWALILGSASPAFISLIELVDEIVGRAPLDPLTPNQVLAS